MKVVIPVKGESHFVDDVNRIDPTGVFPDPSSKEVQDMIRACNIVCTPNDKESSEKEEKKTKSDAVSNEPAG